MSLQLSTTAFSNGGTIPKQYTCDGPDLSPPLSWSGAPSGTQSFALIADDPDAPVGTWVHWVLYNAPAGSNGLAEGVKKQDQLPDGRRAVPASRNTAPVFFQALRARRQTEFEVRS